MTIWVNHFQKWKGGGELKSKQELLEMYQKADIMNCLYELGRRIKLPKDIMDAWKDYGKYNSQTQSVIVDGQRDKEKGYPNQEKDLTNIYKDLYPILTLINNLPD